MSMPVLPFSLEACRRREVLREWRVIDSEEGEVTRRRELNKDNDMDEEGRSVVEEGTSGSSGSTGGTGGSMGEGSTGSTGGSGVLISTMDLKSRQTTEEL
jgi:hypothetical protein